MVRGKFKFKFHDIINLLNYGNYNVSWLHKSYNSLEKKNFLNDTISSYYDLSEVSWLV